MPDAGKIVGHIFIHVDGIAILSLRCRAWFEEAHFQFNNMYRWGLLGQGNFRHACIDFRTTADGFILGQGHYASQVADLEMAHKWINAKDENTVFGRQLFSRWHWARRNGSAFRLNRC